MIKLTKKSRTSLRLGQLGIAATAAWLAIATAGCGSVEPPAPGPDETTTAPSDGVEPAAAKPDDAVPEAAPDGMVPLRVDDFIAGRAGTPAARGPAALPGGGTTAALSFCTGSLALSAVNSGRYVTTMITYTGGDYAMMRALATSPGPWEHYQLCADSATGKWSLFSNQTGGWASAQVNYSGTDYAMLRPVVADIGQWERFDVFTSDGTVFGILSFRSVANGLFVAAEFGYPGGDTGMLRARTPGASRAEWERFQLR